MSKQDRETANKVRFPLFFGRRFARAEDGATAVEFALLGIPFFALLFALIEVCVIYFATANLDSVVAEAGRIIRTGQVQSTGMSEAQFKSHICGELTLINDCESNLRVDVRNFTSFDSLAYPPLIDEDGNIVDSTVFQPGAAGDIVLVNVYYSYGVVSPGMVGLSNVEGGGRLIAAAVAFRNEPFGSILPTS
ncbi:TadE/TadG family type IV pilus assembly protein [Parvibaculum sp.]|jgi:Flp pilus assembly protein TadG|uniref:TadE/TadG family type IV pilus assembly protein n=1 Tax=Parvibaculum sp. TaxID=2024848 RepID=UPI003298D5A2